MNQKPDIERMDEAAYTLKAISNGTRLCVISLLWKRRDERIATERSIAMRTIFVVASPHRYASQRHIELSTRWEKLLLLAEKQTNSPDS